MLRRWLTYVKDWVSSYVLIWKPTRLCKYIQLFFLLVQALVIDLWQVGGFLRVLWFTSSNKTDRNDITEIFLTVALNTISPLTSSRTRPQSLNLVSSDRIISSKNSTKSPSPHLSSSWQVAQQALIHCFQLSLSLVTVFVLTTSCQSLVCLFLSLPSFSKLFLIDQLHVFLSVLASMLYKSCSCPHVRHDLYPSPFFFLHNNFVISALLCNSSFAIVSSHLILNNCQRPTLSKNEYLF